VEHRAVLVMRGKGLSPHVSDVDPHELGPIHESKALSKDAEKTAEILNGFVRLSYQLLKNHPVNKERVKKGLPPANIVLPRGAGMVPHLESLEKRHGIKAGAIAGVSIVKGVCRLAGMEIIDVKGAKGTAESDFDAKIRAGLEYLNEGDLVLINMKAPDLFGHDGDPVGKKRIIEKNEHITAVGTTSVRTLESLYWLGVKILEGKDIAEGILQWDPYNLPGEYPATDALKALLDHMTQNRLKHFNSKTAIIIVPGYKFKVVKTLITNFHQPNSTLLLLIGAFIGYWCYCSWLIGDYMFFLLCLIEFHLPCVNSLLCERKGFFKVFTSLHKRFSPLYNSLKRTSLYIFI